MRKLILIALLAVAASPAISEPFKCRINGKLVIQEHPCPGTVRYSDDLERPHTPKRNTTVNEELAAEQRARTERDKAYIDERVKARITAREKDEASAAIAACDGEVRQLENKVSAIAEGGTQGRHSRNAILEQERRQTQIAALQTQIDALRHQCTLRRAEFDRKFQKP